MDNNIILRSVSKEEYGKVRELAETIWPVCYRNILSEEQINYMMDMMYSENVISEETADGVNYCFIECDRIICGYLAWGVLHSEPSSAKLHKLYLLSEKHGRGIGSRAIELVKQQVKAIGCSRLLLNVNRQNTNAIKCYSKNGFTVVRHENNDIGNGFFMTDYVMETTV